MQPTEDEVIAIKTKPQQQKLSQFFVKRPNKKKATSKTRVAAVPSSLSGIPPGQAHLLLLFTQQFLRLLLEMLLQRNRRL